MGGKEALLPLIEEFPHFYSFHISTISMTLLCRKNSNCSPKIDIISNYMAHMLQVITYSLEVITPTSKLMIYSLEASPINNLINVSY